jgi:hypothetical protein
MNFILCRYIPVLSFPSDNGIQCPVEGTREWAPCVLTPSCSTTCQNQVLDYGESDVDCGGVCGTRCGEGFHCVDSASCDGLLQCSLLRTCIGLLFRSTYFLYAVVTLAAFTGVEDAVQTGEYVVVNVTFGGVTTNALQSSGSVVSIKQAVVDHLAKFGQHVDAASLHVVQVHVSSLVSSCTIQVQCWRLDALGPR